MSSHWPFDQPENCAVISLRQIILEGAPILSASHDAGDHGWQFLDNSNSEESDVMVVSLSQVVALDPSLIQLADLPPGWRAWRESKDAQWTREENLREDQTDIFEEELAQVALAFPHPDEPKEPKKIWWKFW